MMANLANMIYPIIPHASLKIKNMLSLKPYKFEEEVISGDIKIKDLEILYNRIDEIK